MSMCLSGGNRVEAYCLAGLSIIENIQAQSEHADGARLIVLIKFHGQNVVARQMHAIWHKGGGKSGCSVHNHSPHPNLSRTLRINHAWRTLLFALCGISISNVSTYCCNVV